MDQRFRGIGVNELIIRKRGSEGRGPGLSCCSGGQEDTFSLKNESVLYQWMFKTLLTEKPREATIRTAAATYAMIKLCKLAKLKICRRSVLTLSPYFQQSLQ